MSSLPKDIHFFDKFEAAARNISPAAERAQATDLRRLFNELTTTSIGHDGDRSCAMNSSAEQPFSGLVAMLDLLSNGDSSSQHRLSGPPVPDQQGMLCALLSIAKSTRAFYGIKLASLGFHNGQDELLLAIDEAGIQVSLMADQLMIRPSTVSKMLDRLVERGLVERIGDLRDARRTLIRITPAGLEARHQLLDMRDKVDAELAKALNGSASHPAGSELSTTDHLNDCATALAKQLRRLR